MRRYIASYDEAKVAELLDDPGIVRNRLKVRGVIKNALRVSGGAGGVRQLRRLYLAVRGRRADHQ